MNTKSIRRVGYVAATSTLVLTVYGFFIHPFWFVFPIATSIIIVICLSDSDRANAIALTLGQLLVMVVTGILVFVSLLHSASMWAT